MAIYHVFLMLVSLSIEDTPVGYTPSVGTDMHFIITYNQLEYSQPAASYAFNFGPNWNCNWLGYVKVPTSTGAALTLNTRSGGQETYSASSYITTSAYAGYVGYYLNSLQSQATVWVTNSVPPTYERRLPDGSKETYAQLNTADTFAFLSSLVDPQQNTVTLGYDTISSYYTSTHNLRLTTITDALGLSTTLTYGLSADPLKVTQITDPYNRSATFNYTSFSGTYQLTSIIDVIGITSSFNYGTGSAITQMTTPYGNTTFAASTSGTTQILNVTEPDGGQIHAESVIDGTHYPYPISGSGGEPIPSGNGFSNFSGDSLLQYRNTYYWDKKAMQVTGNNPDSDYTKAYIYHFLHVASTSIESPVLESEKPALENRIWYNYPGQTISTNYTGTTANPTEIARVVGTGTTSQVWQYQYFNSTNPSAVTAVIDPLLRQTNYTYDTATGIDLTQVTQTNGTGTNVLKTITYNNTLNPLHCPASVTDASGQTTSFTYNAQGQITSITPPTRSGHSAETTTYGYTSNYLTSITGPVTGTVTALTNDTLNSHTVNRVKTVADSEAYAAGSGAYTRSYTYDNLDRVTQITYPDFTAETFSYLNPTTSHVDLDLHSSTDRLGRTTTRVYDSVRHLKSITDPLSRTTQYGWCTCGAMTSIKDASNNVTTLNRDLESRISSKVYQNSTQSSYTYDTVGRLATITDARNDVTTESYNLDNTLSGSSYALGTGSSAVLPANVTYGYDSVYNRLTTVAQGGTATTTYHYKTITGSTTTGAGRVDYVQEALTGGTPQINYSYDEWGRVTARNIDGSTNNNVATTFDSLGRVTGVNITPLGNFTYSYFDPTHPTNRLGSIGYPNSQSTTFNYLGYTTDERLSEIKNLNSSSAVISQNDYTYYPVGDITSWQQQTDSSTATLWTEGYDNADQLTSAVRSNAVTGAVISNDGFGYDSAGNRTRANLIMQSASFNSVNQLTSVGTASATTLAGSINEPVSLTINGYPVTLGGGNSFSTSLNLPPGTNTVPIVATDGSGNQQTNKYQFTVSTASTASPTYDNDGNMLTTGSGTSYQWDVLNRLVKITISSNTYAFGYDGLGRRISETDNGTLVKQWVWDSSQMVEERNSSNVVQKRFYPQGEQISGTNYFYTRDHLGSVREMTNSSGTIVARYDYDSYGKVTPVGTIAVPSDFQYAGYYTHAPSGLNLTLFRAYDPNVGRWLSRDPIGEYGGINLYGYVGNNPIRFIDPLGLWQFTVEGGDVIGAQITFGNNGGSGWFNGQWNFGTHVGLGEGLAASFDPNDSGCHESGTDKSLRLDGTLKAGPVGAALTADMTDLNGTTTADLGLDTGEAHLTIPLLKDGKPTTAPLPTVGFGEAAILGWGATKTGKCP